MAFSLDLSINPSIIDRDIFIIPRRLQFHFGQGSILLAAIVANEILHLDFSKGMDEFSGEFGWHFETDNHSHWPGFSSLSKHSFPPYIFVKTLHLISVTCLTSEAVSSMVSKCLFLESLTIKECPGLQTLLIHTGHNFHHLTVFNCLQLMSLYIKAPGLQKFRYGGLLPRFKYESSSCLKDAMLDFRGGPSYDPLKYKDLKASEILPDITNVRILTLCRWTFEVCFMDFELLCFCLVSKKPKPILVLIGLVFYSAYTSQVLESLSARSVKTLPIQSTLALSTR